MKPAKLDDHRPKARLVLEDGSAWEGVSFGCPRSVAGEVVFNTGMVGYPETLTDPSYYGQILTLTFPLIGNYGVPASGSRRSIGSPFESKQVQVAALIVSDYSIDYSHWNARRSLADWLEQHHVPALYGIDTRSLTKKLREKGTMLGKIEFDEQPVEFYDPNKDNLVARVSIRRPLSYGAGERRVALIDCGCKNNILQNLVSRGVEVLRVPWDYDLREEQFDGLVVSNGPGDPKLCRSAILQIRHCVSRNIPVLGICLGHQLLSLAAGANTYKLKYGHRSQNQPVLEVGTNRCLITSQNHGFAVDNKTLPTDWKPWFINLNDQTNEGIRHKTGPFMSIQFHPEAAPGPADAAYLFDEFIRMVAQ